MHYIVTLDDPEFPFIHCRSLAGVAAAHGLRSADHPERDLAGALERFALELLPEHVAPITAIESQVLTCTAHDPYREEVWFAENSGEPDPSGDEDLEADWAAIVERATAAGITGLSTSDEIANGGDVRRGVERDLAIINAADFPEISVDMYEILSRVKALGL